MQLARLIYTSTASDRCDQKQVEGILEVSMKLNAVNGITGILYYSSEYFMQYLEGGGDKVDETYARLARDERHHSLRLVEAAAIQSREFEDWNMAYVPKSTIITPLNLEFMRGTEFNPREISASEALELTKKLRELLPKAHYESVESSGRL